MAFEAKVKDEHPLRVVTAFGGREYVKGAWRPVQAWQVSDRAAVVACERFLDDHRVLVEPACGAGLAAVYDAAAPLQGVRSVLVIVCGGAGVSLALLRAWAEATRA